ncbi:MAG: 50S ribosomal protein L15 [Clostridia bacterium]|nr:50S ribosomal protein L15 [Clostridia bacterium]
MFSLNNIKRASGATKKKKRIGRGDASGHGTYSTKGIKGQKARSGVSNLKRLGMRRQLLQTPKLRGFKSLQAKNQLISVSVLNANFKDGEIVNPQVLFDRGLIKNVSDSVKILGKEKLTVKVKLEKLKMSKSVREQI